jgi:hypothetical protein
MWRAVLAELAVGPDAPDGCGTVLLACVGLLRPFIQLISRSNTS